MHASVYRNNRFELDTLKQHANHFVVVCSERRQVPDVVVIDAQERLRARRSPSLPLHESLYTEEEMRIVQAALEIHEIVYERVYAEWEKHPDRTVEAIEQALVAQRELEQHKAEAAKVIADAEFARELAHDLAEVERRRIAIERQAHTEAMAAERAAHEAEIARLQAGVEAARAAAAAVITDPGSAEPSTGVGQ